MSDLKSALKSILTEAQGIVSAAGDRGMTQEQAQNYAALINQAEAVKAQIDTAAKAAQMTQWLEQPAGSVVKSSFDRMALPGEGEIQGVSAGSDGEMYAIDPTGEKKLNSLKSGAYKDAFNTYLRAAGTGRSMKGDAMKVLNEGTDTAGGFWLPPDFRAEVVKKLATMTQVRKYASVYTTGTDSITFPKVTYTADDLYTSGARFAWQASSPLAADISEATNPVAGRITIPLHSATAAIIMTREQMEDNSFDILGYISGILAEAYALGEEDAFLNGNGAGQPWGILNHTNATVDSTAGGMVIISGTDGAVTWQGVSGSENPATGLLGVEGALPPQYEANARWLASKKTFAAVRGLVDSNKRPLWQLSDGGYGNWIQGYPATLLGYPIAKSNFMPELATAAQSVLFGDFGGYYIADRVGLSIEVLREVRALRGEVVVYARKRVGGQLVHDWKMKLLKASS